MTAISIIRAAGIRLQRDGEKIVASPKSKLTDELRTLIRANRAELLVLVEPVHKPIAWLNPDRYCYPHSAAANTAELATMERRLDLLARRGIGLYEAERLIDVLLHRDRDGDDRRLCLECQHGTRTRCPNGHPLPEGVLQRCEHFTEAQA